ncbi:MAG: bifunctional folylpolyglutamate synthase/dihydrofolate synthase [Eubacteriales bacterium]|nr:bifunctional folylpolyglutamate synthase/dihydrofolate synthase [Eubacteriales bacterium]
MNDIEAREYIQHALTFGIRLGLERMNRLLELLDHPEAGFRIIHIAGTNGKGSVTSYCAAILACADHRVGVYTSPFIERFTERMRVIDGRRGLDRLESDEASGEITADVFANLMTKIRSAVDIMLANGEEHPTEFELITACAFLFFQVQRCEWVVLETGLGGRLDSTNVICNPERIIITALGYDHMDRLGSTIAAIATEKAGIIKPQSNVFLYDPFAALPTCQSDAEQALAVVNETCQRQKASLLVIQANQVKTENYSITGQQFTFRDVTYTTQLLGLFQPMNAALAISACKGLTCQQAIDEGISRARWPARLEVLPATHSTPLVMLDGAHNPQGCRALGDALDRLVPDQGVVFLVGLLADKDYQTMLSDLFSQRRFQIDTIMCTTPDNPRALAAESLAQAMNELKIDQQNGYNRRDMVQVSEHPEVALHRAIHLALERQIPLCAFGSLYLVGQLRSWIKLMS